MEAVCAPNDKNKMIVMDEVPKQAEKRGFQCGCWVRLCSRILMMMILFN